MSAQFILSFDCEGKWGVADLLSKRHSNDLSDERLRFAYREIVGMLDEFDIRATFAFVGLFSQSSAEFAQLRPAIEPLRHASPGFLGMALQDIDSCAGDGWHGDHLLAEVAESNLGHEIALHGVTHVPWPTMFEPLARLEMELAAQLSGPIRNSRTFVYPRNQVAHSNVLQDAGLAGFRTARNRSRLVSLLSEFNIFQRPDHYAPANGLVRIPPGFFLNWRSGLRAAVPIAMTRLRVRRLLDTAGKSGGIVHFWLHPENIASSPSTLGVLRALLAEVASAREAGACNVLTQLDFCERATVTGDTIRW
jgi:peptidoglycan/xylan/chitin deacetylase (PgdA/CDA1 family)